MMQRFQYFDTAGESPTLASYQDFRSRVQERTGGQPPRGDLDHSFFPQFDFVKAIVAAQPEIGDHEKAVIQDTFSVVDGVPTVGWTVKAAPPPTSEQVSAERDRRGLLDFTWNGIAWQGDEESTKKIMGLVTSATIYLTIGGGSPSETKWMDGINDFKFTAKDDSEHILTAPQMIQMGQALGARVNFLHRKAKDIKAMDPIPVDYQTNEALWT